MELDPEDRERNRKLQAEAGRKSAGQTVDVMRKRYRRIYNHPDDGGAYMLKGHLDV